MSSDALCDPSGDKKLHPKLDELMSSIQDEGVPDKKKEAKTLKYNKIHKFAGSLYKKWKAHGFPNLPTNQTRGKDAIVKILIRNRKHVDCTEVSESLRQYGKNGKVYIIQNDDETGGFHVIIAALANFWLQTQRRHKDNRTPEDGMRNAAALLQPKYRGTVQGIISGKKDRAKQDQANNTADAFYVQIQDDFEDPHFIVKRPDGVKHIKEHAEEAEEVEDDVDVGIDPNNIDIITKQRDDNFARKTWEDYTRPKYKRALKKWIKDTGNGSKDVANFPNYCDGDRWLLWVYMLDMEQGFLLASGAGGSRETLDEERIRFPQPKW